MSFGVRKIGAALVLTGTALTGSLLLAAESSAEPVRGPDGNIYQVNGYLGSKAVQQFSNIDPSIDPQRSWYRAWEACRQDPAFGSQVRSVKKFRSYWDPFGYSVVMLDDYFCSSSETP